MSSRFKSSTYKFNQPLSTPDSEVVYHCYAAQGKAFAKNPPANSKIRMLCINDAREVKWADGLYTWQEYECDEMRGKKGWKRLGWVMADGSLPLGEFDIVDPALTQLGYLQTLDTRDVYRGPPYPLVANVMLKD